MESSSSTTTTMTSPPQQQPHVVVEPLNSDSFKELKNEIKRTHRRARPFDVINEPPPKTTIECSIGTFTTQQPYYRSLYVAHDEYDAEQFGPAITKKPLIPRWRVKEVSSSSDEDEKMESDEEYARRHHKYELEEKRLIKKDALVKESRMKVSEHTSSTNLIVDFSAKNNSKPFTLTRASSTRSRSRPSCRSHCGARPCPTYATRPSRCRGSRRRTKSTIRRSDFFTNQSSNQPPKPSSPPTPQRFLYSLSLLQTLLFAPISPTLQKINFFIIFFNT